MEISHLGIVDLFLFQMMCFAPAVTISQVIIAGLKFWPVLLRTMSKILVSWSAIREIVSFVFCPLKTVIFPCPACCFKWHASRRRKASGVLGSPLRSSTGTRASPVRLIPYPIRCRSIRIPEYIQKGKWQIAPAW